MKKINFSNKRILLSLIPISIIVIVTLVLLTVAKDKPTQDIYFFYDGVCGECNTDSEFIDLFNLKVGDIKESVEHQVNIINTFKFGDTQWTKLCDELNIPLENRILPMVILGDNYAAGNSNIEQNIRSLFCENFDIIDTKTLTYYYRPDCPDCVRVEPFFNETLALYPELNVIKIDTTNSIHKELFKKKLDEWNVPEEQWQVPFIHYQKDYLSGYSEIEEKLIEFLD